MNDKGSALFWIRLFKFTKIGAKSTKTLSRTFFSILLNSYKIYSIHDGSVSLEYRFFDLWNVPVEWIHSLPVFVSSFGALVWTFLSLVSIFLHKRKIKTVRAEEFEAYKQDQKQRDIYYQQRILEKDNEINKLITINKQQKEINARQKNETEIQIKRHKQKIADLEKQLSEEPEVIYKTSPEEMQASLDVLNEKIKTIKDEARIFGIDFDAKNYDSLLKGRQYEIVVASALVENGQFEILEWTPDKGFDKNIPVSSNTNPDLVVRDKQNREAAVECKYKTKYFWRDGNNGIAWTYPAQLERYLKFSNERNIPVYIASARP